jgi:hypothetical protein
LLGGGPLRRSITVSQANQIKTNPPKKILNLSISPLTNSAFEAVSQQIFRPPPAVAQVRNVVQPWAKFALTRSLLARQSRAATPTIPSARLNSNHHWSDSMPVAAASAFIYSFRWRRGTRSFGGCRRAEKLIRNETMSTSSVLPQSGSCGVAYNLSKTFWRFPAAKVLVLRR